MGSDSATDRRSVTRLANVLFGGAGAVALMLLFARPRWALAATLLVGWLASLLLARFALRFRRNARRGLAPGVPAAGRIVENREAERIAFDMPAAGTEPWLADAWILLVATTAVVVLSAFAGVRVQFSLGFVVILTLALGFRLANAPADRLRIELGNGAWLVEALVSGRPVRRSGTGAILPELVDDALVLWSREGRIGVLRGELEAEERGWLAARLASLIAERDLESVEIEARAQAERRDQAVLGEPAVEPPSGIRE